MRTRSISIHTIMLTTGLVLVQDQAQAQLIQQEDILPPVGATWHMRALQVVPPLPADELPLVWRFADLTGNDVFGVTWSMLDPTQVPIAGSYPDADRVLFKDPDYDAPEIHTFLDVGSDQCVELASVAPFVTNRYDPGALYAAYPMDFGQEVEMEHCYTAATASGLTPYCGNTRIWFMKVGELQLNFGDFPEARLIRTRVYSENQVDTTINTVLETFTWFAPGLPYPLLQFNTYYYSNGTQAHNGYILDPTSIVGLEEPAVHSALGAYPVPSAGVVNFEALQGGSLSILSGDGRLVHAERLQPSSGVRTVDLSALPPGAYRAVLRDERTIRSAAILIGR